jgi:hypothetical protein
MSQTPEQDLIVESLVLWLKWKAGIHQEDWLCPFCREYLDKEKTCRNCPIVEYTGDYCTAHSSPIAHLLRARNEDIQLYFHEQIMDLGYELFHVYAEEDKDGP